MAKQLVFGNEAREAVLEGVQKLSRAVISTLGPKGRCAVLDKSWGGPTVTKDGVSVAKEIDLEDKNENLGAQLVKQAASKTSDRAGDGTTTATLLAAGLFEHGLRYVTAGSAPSELLRGMRQAADAARTTLQELAKPVDTEQVAAVGTIAANNDATVGGLLADAMEKVGKDGVITVDDGQGLDTQVKIVEGMQFDRGFLSPYFATNTDTLECAMKDALVFIHEEKISSAQQLLPVLEQIKESKSPLLLIAEDIDGEALATLVVNKVRGILDVVAVKAPGYGDRRKEMLHDIAVLTNSQPYMKDDGSSLESFDPAHLGRAKRILIDNNSTTIIEGAGDRQDVQARAALIRKQAEETTSDYDREKLQERLARLVGGIAEIQVGGATEIEVKEKKARIEDALHATRAAVAEGILPGGGVALLRAADALEELRLDGDAANGVSLVRKALEQPIRVIASNADCEPSSVVRRVRAGEDDFGYNALTSEYGSMHEFGVIDPLVVTRTALDNAVSVATVLLTTDCLITEIPKDEENEGAADPGAAY